MDFNLPEELQILKETIRRFVDKELIPLEREYRPEGEEMPERLLRPLQEKAKALGLWMLDVPQDFAAQVSTSSAAVSSRTQNTQYSLLSTQY
jgi:acyl-CoA dehydrogenase